jgi:predicted transcriptional regulator
MAIQRLNTTIPELQNTRFLRSKRRIRYRINGTGAVGLKDENSHLREENAKLKDMVASKDAELKNWRAKLKSMMGSDLE